MSICDTNLDVWQLKLIYATVYTVLEIYPDTDVETLAGRKAGRKYSFASTTSSKSALSTSTLARSAMSLTNITITSHAQMDFPCDAIELRFPDWYKMTKAFKKGLKSLDTKLARDTWYWLTRDSSDKLLMRYLRQFNDPLKVVTTLGEAIYLQAYSLRSKRELYRGERFYQCLRDDSSYIAALKRGKAMIVGTDKNNQPLIWYRASLHSPADHKEQAEGHLVTMLYEVAYLAQTDWQKGCTWVFDMKDYTLENFDRECIKFLCTIANKAFPLVAGKVLIHNAPKVLARIYQLTKRWLDPSIQKKVVYTHTVNDLFEYIPLAQIPRYAGGLSRYDSAKWVDPRPEDDILMSDKAGRHRLKQERKFLMSELESLTFHWILGDNNIKARDEVLKEIERNFWELDPYVRSRTIWDRHGVLGLCRPEFASGGIAQPTCQISHPTFKKEAMSIGRIGAYRETALASKVNASTSKA